MFAGGEVLRFDGLLGGRDALGDEPGLDGHVLFHAQAEHEVLHALAAEDAQQVVLQREEEARGAGVALAAGAAAQAGCRCGGTRGARCRRCAGRRAATTSSCSASHCCLVAWRRSRSTCRAARGSAVVVLEVVEVLVGDEVGLLRGTDSASFCLQALFLGHELGVAAEQDVGTAAGHVGGDGDRALAAGLRDDVGFALVVLGVQHFVPDAHLLEDRRRAFRTSRPRWCRPARAGPFALRSLISLAALRNFSSSVR